MKTSTGELDFDKIKKSIDRAFKEENFYHDTSSMESTAPGFVVDGGKVVFKISLDGVFSYCVYTNKYDFYVCDFFDELFPHQDLGDIDNFYMLPYAIKLRDFNNIHISHGESKLSLLTNMFSRFESPKSPREVKDKSVKPLTISEIDKRINDLSVLKENLKIYEVQKSQYDKRMIANSKIYTYFYDKFKEICFDSSGLHRHPNRESIFLYVRDKLDSYNRDIILERITELASLFSE